MRYLKILALLPALLLCAAPAISEAAVDVSFSVDVAPPPLPIYEQPPLPAPGYLWTPGYWAWDGADYYWVPGTWVLPPASDLLWTPGYWGWRDGFFGWNPGYWGTEVGFYGGVDYGFGYPGVGYRGGYWHGGAFFYNRAVANFGHVRIANVYSAPVEHHARSYVSFNGGQGGLHAQPDAQQRRVMSERHRDPTPMQREHAQRAAAMPDMHLSRNGGHPRILTTQRAGDFAHPGAGLRNHQQRAPATREIHQQPRQRQIEGAGPAMRNEDRQERRGPAPEAPRVHEQVPHEQIPHEQVPHAQPPHGPAPHEQAPRPQNTHERERHEPEPNHDH